MTVKLRFCAILSLCLAISVGLSAEPKREKLTPALLREYSREQLKAKAVTVPAPRIVEEPDGLYFVFDGPNGLIDGNDPPLTVILEEQLRATSYSMAKTSVPADQWKKMLTATERIIDSMVADYNAGPDPETLARNIADKSTEIHLIHRQAMSDYAKSKGKRLMPYAENRRIFVEVSSDPKGATIHYLPAGHWDLYRFMTETKKLADYPKLEWISIRQDGPMNFAADGVYYFHVKWATAEKGLQERVQITKSGKLVFNSTGHSTK